MLQFEVILDDIKRSSELISHTGVAASDINFLHKEIIS